MVMFCTQEDTFPQSSPAVHVRWILPSQGIKPEVTSVNVTVGLESQLSVVVAVPQFAGLVLVLQAIVFEGGHTITGGVLSIVCIVVLQVLMFPQKSVTVSVTGCRPQPVTILGLTFIEAIPQLSVEPPSIRLGVIDALQFASSVTPTPRQIAVGGMLSVKV